MKQKDFFFLGLILLFSAISILIVLPATSSRLGYLGIQRSLDFVLGLDLRGGVQALLEVPATYLQEITPDDLANAKAILENRTNALGVSENQFQVAGERRIVAEFPGLSDPEQVLAVIKETGLMEFVDLGDNAAGFGPGDKIRTDLNASTSGDASRATLPPTIEGSIPPTNPSFLTKDAVYHTIMTGGQLKSVFVSPHSINAGSYVINFELKPEGAKIFSDYTRNNVGKTLAIVLDKKILSAPTIQSHIDQGSGFIESFDNETANSIAVQMRYGALPIPFEVVERRVIGPTLGQDSLTKSLIAGLIGFAIVILFMGIYYRLPGIIAIFSILVYAILTLAMFKLIPVTLTLPGIAGFLLSTGSALDANILLFERLKEELRSGKSFRQAVDLAWKRALPSIRDSNIAILITCSILFWFGSSFGATFVKGFAFTLAVGVFISILCAFFVTRTLLNVVIGAIHPDARYMKWLGITE